ncbi:APC family permease [Microbacterium sp. NPDC080220]|uniref:APC family permease n=1 Tax=Microbacterium sp. NPDC080220 TaxID=3161017 RepID=UPI003416EC0D
MTALERAIARPQPVRAFSATSPLDGLRRRSVGPADVLAQSVAAVAPTAAATTVILLVAGAAGSGTVLAVAVATVLALLVAATVNQFARRLAATGSLYTYAARGAGPVAALATGGSIVVGYGFISVFSLLGGAHYLTMLLARVWPGVDASSALIGALLAEAAVLAVVLARGIRLSSRVALVVEIVSVTVVVGLMIALIVAIGGIQVAVLVPAAGVSPTAVAAGAVLALTAFVGFESAATLGVEARSPLRTIPRAVVGTVLVAGTLYLLASATQVAGFAALGRDLSSSTAPVDDLAGAMGMGGLSAVADVGIAASFLACAIASTTALTRIVFAMARDGVLPRTLGRTHSRHRTPIAAVRAVVPILTLVPVVVVAAGARPWAAMEVVLVVSASGYIVAYAIVCLAAVRFLRRIGESTRRATVVSVIAAVSIIACLAVYLVVEAQAGNVGVWISAGVALATTALIAVRMRRGAPDLDSVGRYDVPVAAQVLGGIPAEAEAATPGDGHA